ncbi:efflux RND transporter periplasmic adaptor subunit [Parvibaculum sp.]|uniref:efflux RND transporter periplasmic adaptor subunit n=1 Tax=Parvibaculum sp. TaxID=2024848 RepID=UPI002C7A3A18|nr:efflux RND transporter periplasmic adaptor subunit [Parvibaculum sp.]HUD50270.1 efflux RND transporter periplasmic adaptor subunit [Parvibaculum sp.]
MTRRMVIMLAIVGIILAGFIGFQMLKAHFIKNFVASMGNQAATVSAITASNQSWSPSLRAVGSLRAVRGTDIAPQLAGVVSDIPFKSGEEVQAGDVLLQLADEDDVANLNALKASAELARLTYERNKELVRTRAVSQASLDNAVATYRSAQAQVAAQQALVNKKQIRAPFAGRVGIRLVDVGQYLSPGTKVTTLQSLDPIFIDFSLPQQSVRLVEPGQQVTATTDAFPGETFTGKIVAIDSKLDAETRNVSVRAELANPGHKLLPGMFGSVTIVTGAPQSILTLPRTAITYNPYGQSIYLVRKGEAGEDGKPVLTVEQSFVTTGEARGDQIAIVKGVKEGDMVVTAGQIKLRNGSHVVIDNSVKMPNEAEPTVQDR